MPRLSTIATLVLLTAGLSGCASYDHDYYEDECDPHGGQIGYEEVEYRPPPHRYRSGHYQGGGDHGYAGHHRRHDYNGPHGGYRGGRY